mmetsp:Transcript_19894/g.75179  ORF Transcript_19894/g.75179 Transcript_19894/m.75179 type:complete len:214 (+) Transcript_19894:442-1083(+)
MAQSLSSCLHHEPSPDRVQRIYQRARRGGDDLRKQEARENGGIVPQDLVPEEVVATHVESAEDDDPRERHWEAMVQLEHTTPTEHLDNAIKEPRELPLGQSSAHIRRKSRPCQVQRVRPNQAGAPRRSTSCQVPQEESPRVFLADFPHEHGLVLVLACKVDGLLRKVSHDVGHVSTPEAQEALLVIDSPHAVHHAAVALLSPQLYRRTLRLEQ